MVSKTKTSINLYQTIGEPFDSWILPKLDSDVILVSEKEMQ